MTQLIINIEDKTILPHLKKILGAIQGVTIAKSQHKKKSGLDVALDDIRKGRVNHYDSIDDMFESMNL